MPLVTVGPNNPGSSSTYKISGVGDVDWTNPGNILTSNNARANWNAGGGSTISYALLGSNFGFSIPSDPQIVVRGLFFEAELNSNDASENVSVRAQVSNSLFIAPTVTANPNGADAYYSGGGTVVTPTRSGVILTPAQVNASTFGVVVNHVNSFGYGGTYDLNVDHVRATVYYERVGELSQGFAIF